jgi:hypothetical protein
MSLTNSTPKKVIIFDWDDTICPSSFVDQHKVERFNDLPLHVSQAVIHFIVRERLPMMLSVSWLDTLSWFNRLVIRKPFCPNKNSSRVCEMSFIWLLHSPTDYCANNNILCSLSRLFLFLSQFQNLFNELGKVAEECLDAASKHGEVSSFWSYELIDIVNLVASFRVVWHYFVAAFSPVFKNVFVGWGVVALILLSSMNDIYSSSCMNMINRIVFR